MKGSHMKALPVEPSNTPVAIGSRIRAARQSQRLTIEQVADATGLTPVHTNRTLQSLRKDGVIQLTTTTLTVLDWDRLAAVGDFNERYLHHTV